jgi:hypothetical protein
MRKLGQAVVLCFVTVPGGGDPQRLIAHSYGVGCWPRTVRFDRDPGSPA